MRHPIMGAVMDMVVWLRSLSKEKLRDLRAEVRLAPKPRYAFSDSLHDILMNLAPPEFV